MQIVFMTNKQCVRFNKRFWLKWQWTCFFCFSSIEWKNQMKRFVECEPGKANVLFSDDATGELNGYKVLWIHFCRYSKCALKLYYTYIYENHLGTFDFGFQLSLLKKKSFFFYQFGYTYLTFWIFFQYQTKQETCVGK